MTRAIAASPTIPVSCGHRVPRIPSVVDGRRVYWCATCGEYRMSGHASTGERSFAFLLELAEDVRRAAIVVPDPGTERGRAVVLALGARIGGAAA